MAAGYSGTPLAKKLGIKAGMILCTIYAPDHYLELLRPLPDGITWVDESHDKPVDFIHLFAKDRVALDQFPSLKPLLDKSGLFWVS